MLTIGTRLGPYEIQSAIGAGGMGEVYKARDTRLDRCACDVRRQRSRDRRSGRFHDRRHGAEPGRRAGAPFAIYRDVYLSDQVPPVAVGEAVVVSTLANSSLIRVTRTRDAVMTGDLLVARKRGESAAAAAAATSAQEQTAVGAGEGSTPRTTTSAPETRRPVRDYMFEDVHFDFDQYTLRPEALSIVDEAVTALQQDPTLRLQIEGHTCNIGTAEYNLALGARRAQAVHDYLTSRGIPAGRLTTVSYGEERPKHDNSQEETRRQNRRAALVVDLQQ